jgi:dUTP pyrophosphatase
MRRVQSTAIIAGRWGCCCNLSDQPFQIAHGDRIAQLVVAPVVRGVFATAYDLSDTARGAGGFGSTGRA